jgi:hypothetical protein
MGRMKKLVGSLLIVIFLCFGVTGFTQNVNAAPAEGNDIVITGHSTNPSTVYAGNFTLSMALRNISGTELSNIFLVIDGEGASSFSVLSGGAVQKIDDTLMINYEGTKSFTLVYNGGDSTRLPIKITYDKNSTPYEVNTYLAINAIPNSSQPKPDPVDTTKYIPKLSVSGSSIPSGKAGEMISVPVQIKNTSSYEAKNIVITPQLGEDNLLEADTLNLSQLVSSIRTGSEGSASFNFKIAETAASKSYPVKLKFEFENAYGNPFTSESTIYIKVIGQEGGAKLLVKDINCSNPIILPGDTTGLNIKLINSGSLPLKDIKVSLIGLKEEGLTLFGGSSSQYLNYLNKGEESALVFNLAVSKKMTKGNYALSLKLEYKDSTGKEGSDEQQFFIPVQGDDNQGTKTVPKIILDQYSSSPSIVKAGQNFQLNMSFLNTSEAKLVKNIKIYLTVNETSTEGANIFTPVNSSNTFFIDSIAPKGKVSKSLTMYTIPDAKQKTYTINANFEYEDGEGNEYKATELIGVPVTQITNVDTSEIAFPPEAYPGQPVPVSFDFYNTGKTLLRNFMIKLEGDFQSQNGSYFVGNFDVGASDHYEASIIPGAPGQLTGAIVISFDDPTGQNSEIKKDFTMNVMEMPVQENPGMDPGMKPSIPKEGGIKGILKNKFLWIGLGIIAVTIVSGIIIRKRIIKKREDMTLDE